MAYQIRYIYWVDYLAPGAGALGSVPAQQTLSLGQPALQGIGLATVSTQPTGKQLVPGGESPTQANFNTACSSALTDIEAAIAANLGQIQGFATGGG